MCVNSELSCLRRATHQFSMGCASSAPKSAYVLSVERGGDAVDDNVRQLRGSDASQMSAPASPSRAAAIRELDERKLAVAQHRSTRKRRSKVGFSPKNTKLDHHGRRGANRGSFVGEASPHRVRGIRVKITDFEVGPCIGVGAFARVYVARYKGDKQWYALKQVKKSRVTKVSRAEALRAEKFALSTLHSPFVVDYRTTFQDADHLYFMLEFLAGGELFTRAHRKTMPEEECKFYMAEILCALEAIHEKGLIFRDLKPENVVLDNTGHVRVVDFGFATMLDKRGRAKGKVGTPHYLAPEMLHKSAETEGYGVGVDFWAFGCLMYELLAGKAAFGSAADSPYAIYTRIMSGKLRLPRHFSSAVSALLRRLLTPSPVERLSACEEIRECEWFSGLDWGAVREKRLVPPWLPKLDSMHDLRHFDLHSESSSAHGGKMSSDARELLLDF